MQFNHLNFDSLKFLASRRMVDGLPDIRYTDRICDMCLRKQLMDSFHTSKSWRDRRPLEIINSDLYTMEIHSTGGCRYFIIYINDFSRKDWIYFLKKTLIHVSRL